MCEVFRRLQELGAISKKQGARCPYHNQCSQPKTISFNNQGEIDPCLAIETLESAEKTGSFEIKYINTNK